MGDQLLFNINQQNPHLDQMDQNQIRQHILDSILLQADSRQKRGLGPHAPADIDAFGPLLKHVLGLQQSREGINNPIDVSEAYPPVDTTKETITYSLQRRMPGTFSQDAPFTGVKNFKPLFRESYPDPANPGYITVVLGVLFDNLMNVTCWAKTNREADQRALWLESVLLANTWMFRYSGFNQVLYMGRGEDTHNDVNSIRLMGRSLQYYLRTEKLITVSEKTIDEILLAISLKV